VDLARFIIGEITAALLYIHSLGLAYNDLKPENVLITKLGHVKISDFGACRAVSEEGKDLLRTVSASAGGLGGLRSGGWWEEEGKGGPASALSATRAEQENALWSLPPQSVTPAPLSTAHEVDNVIEIDSDTIIDYRAEGTPAYLPPEVLQNENGGIPGAASDVWALGCLLLFLLRGRSPFCGDRAAVLEQQAQAGMSSVIVSAANTTANIQNQHDVDMEYKAVSFTLPQHLEHIASIVRIPESRERTTVGADSLSGTLKSMLNGLLCIHPQNRYKLSDVVQHEWFVGCTGSGAEGIDPLNLHKSVPPAWPGPWPSDAVGASTGGGADQGEDASAEEEEGGDDLWARRQHSVLWYAMPAPVADDIAALAAGAREGGGGDRTGDGSGSGCSPYDLVAVPETDFEQHASFM